MNDRVAQVAVVVPTRDRAERLAALLGALRAQTFQDFEVVVVDDASRQALSPDGVRTIRNERPRGPSAARNAGWRATGAPLVAFTDDDCVPESQWLEALVEEARSHPGAIVQGAVAPIASERGRLGPFSRSLWVDELGPWFQTANVLYPRDLLERLGGFDEAAFPFVGEDCDLAWRALEQGTDAVWAPQARVGHAVAELGPAGALRVAARWGAMMGLFPRHRGLREAALTHRVFWKGSHYLLVRALVALALPRRLWLLRLWLGAPYARHLLLRGRHDGGGPLAAPWYALHDLVELAAVARGAARHRTLVL